MRDIVDQLLSWHEAGIEFAVATVIRTFSSAPRSPGTSMAVSVTGEVVGSISGGCVEAAVVAEAEIVLNTGLPVHQRFGVSDDDAFAVGLTCGGTIDVYVERASDELIGCARRVRKAMDTGTPLVMGTVIAGEVAAGRHVVVTDGVLEGTLGTEELDRSARTQLVGALHTGADAVLQCGGPGQDCADEVTLFARAISAPPHMIVFGAVDFARSLVQIGKMLGYFVTLCDARPVFATRARFPEADEIVVDWPHRYLDSVAVDNRTVLCVLTHDEKFDVPLLEKALRLPAAYVGAMGSRRTTLRREHALRERGLSEVELARLCAPIGLDIGGRTPAETALAIGAEIVSLREGRTGLRLKDNGGAIHADPAAPLVPLPVLIGAPSV